MTIITAQLKPVCVAAHLSEPEVHFVQAVVQTRRFVELQVVPIPQPPATRFNLMVTYAHFKPRDYTELTTYISGIVDAFRELMIRVGDAAVADQPSGGQ